VRAARAEIGHALEGVPLGVALLNADEHVMFRRDEETPRGSYDAGPTPPMRSIRFSSFSRMRCSSYALRCDGLILCVARGVGMSGIRDGRARARVLAKVHEFLGGRAFGNACQIQPSSHPSKGKIDSSRFERV
jgi:hypothetical protein